MICDSCKDKGATVFLTQIVQGEVKKVNLCQDCSQEKGVTDPTGFALADLLVGIGSEQTVEVSPADETCSACGFTRSDFKKTGRLGCSNCYEEFRDGLESLLRAMHKGVRHIGKVPEGAVSDAMEDQLEQLRTTLDEAVAEERFEDAASLRDQIKKLSEGEEQQ